MFHRIRTALVCLAAGGLVLAAMWASGPGAAQPPKEAPPGQSGRYQMVVWGVKENPYLVLLDTQTGQAWYRGFAGETAFKWDDMETPPSKQRGRPEQKPQPSR
jgi:hypothetical protein